MAVRPALNLRVADRLLDEGLITQKDHLRAVEYARGRSHRVEEALLELDIIDEVELLRFMAKMHRTQFVSTERMSKAKLDRAALRMVPKKLAQLYGLFPLLYDQGSQRLVVATADPDNLSALDDLRVATRADEIRALAARPAAVVAAIARGYDGEKFAFSNLLRGVDSLGGIKLPDPFMGDAEPAAEPPRQAAPTGRRAAAPEPAARQASPFRPRRQAPSVERAVAPYPDHPLDEQSWDAEPEPPRERVRTPREAPPREPPPRRERVRTPREAPPRQPPPERARTPRDAPPRQPPPERARTPREAPPQPAATPPAAAAPRSPELSSTMRSVRGAELISDDAIIGGAPVPAPPVDPEEEEPLGGYSQVDRRGAELDDPFGDHPGLEPLAPAQAPSSPAELAVEQQAGPPVSVEDAEPTPRRERTVPPPPSRLNVGKLSRRSDRPPPLSSHAGLGSLIEALRVLVGLLENEREDLRGHSSIVARLVQDACERVGLSGGHTAALVVAAHLHDLGKRASGGSGPRAEAQGPVHITALNAAHLPSIKELARKLVGLPEQLMEGVGLPEQTKTALRTMYEHMDGTGIPHGMHGKDIAIGGRILAVADTYADLTHNARNTYDKVLSPERAMEVLHEHAGTVFDTSIVDVFGHAMTGEQILGQLLDERHRVLIIDPDPEQTLVLQLRLSDQGFEVHLARSTEEARAALMSRKFALIVSEIDLEEPDAGLFLREEVSKMASGNEISWVFLSGRSSRNTLKRAFDMGVDDFISKPASVEIVVAKLVQLVEREVTAQPTAPRGVSGSLSDMAMTDIVQILFHGQRTGALHIEWPDAKGEVHFKDGRIVNCVLGDVEGENAFYRMLSMGEDGRFHVDPLFEPSGESKINASPEGLLLEGMRLLDEGMVP